MPGGRPTKYDGERAARILEALREGNTLRNAAALAGIAESTLHAWRGEFPEFSEAIRRSQAEAEAADVQCVTTARAGGDWKAAAWRLERRNNREWGLKIRVEVDREIDAFLAYMEEHLDAETFERVRVVALGFGAGADEVGAAELERAALAARGVDPEAPAGLPEPDASRSAPRDPGSS